MRIYNIYIVSLALASGLINTLLAVLGQNDLGLYFTVNVLAYLVITLLYAYLNPRATRAITEAIPKVDKQSNIVIISQRNYDAEALTFNAFSFTRKGNAVITI